MIRKSLSNQRDKAQDQKWEVFSNLKDMKNNHYLFIHLQREVRSKDKDLIQYQI